MGCDVLRIGSEFQIATAQLAKVNSISEKGIYSMGKASESCVITSELLGLDRRNEVLDLIVDGQLQVDKTCSRCGFAVSCLLAISGEADPEVDRSFPILDEEDDDL